MRTNDCILSWLIPRVCQIIPSHLSSFWTSCWFRARASVRATRTRDQDPQPRSQVTMVRELSFVASSYMICVSFADNVVQLWLITAQYSLTEGLVSAPSFSGNKQHDIEATAVAANTNLRCLTWNVSIWYTCLSCSLTISFSNVFHMRGTHQVILHHIFSTQCPLYRHHK